MTQDKFTTGDISRWMKEPTLSDGRGLSEGEDSDSAGFDAFLGIIAKIGLFAPHRQQKEQARGFLQSLMLGANRTRDQPRQRSDRHYLTRRNNQPQRSPARDHWGPQ